MSFMGMRSGCVGYLVFTGDVKCFDGDCYPLAFGVPAILMVIATREYNSQ